MQKIDFGTNEKFINLYQELKSAQKVADRYGCSKTAVLNHAKKINFDVKSVQKYKLSDKDKKEIIESYLTSTSTQLAKKYNVSRGMITKIWYDNNCRGKEIKVSPYSIDLTGKRINLLTVLHKTSERNTSGCVLWTCQCDCGNIINVSSTLLNKQSIKSCGCLSKKALEKGRGLNFQDLTGKKFGKLKVLYRDQDKILKNNRYVNWACQCECGRKLSVLASNLRTGNTQSCGFCGSNSHGNNKIETILTKAGIPFEREKRFSTCKDKACLPFDFFVNNQYLIEYDGEQHTNTDCFFYSEKTVSHDKIKNHWCEKNNIPLIRIPFSHYPDLCLEDLLLQTSKYIYVPTKNCGIKREG